MKSAEWVVNPAVGGFKVSPATLSSLLWREPNTGVIMLRPNTVHPKFWEDTAFKAQVIDISKWDFKDQLSSGSGSSILGAVTGTGTDGLMLTARGSPAALMIEILVRLALRAILAQMSSEMVWVMQTKDPLAANEGWSVWVHPPGTFTDRAIDYMLIAFGDRYVLHVKMNGTASLWANSGTDAAPSWSEKTVFKYSGGGVDHNKPFQITIVPWGFSYISFLFSQSSEPEKHTKADLTGNHTASFLYDIAKHEPIGTAYFDNTTQQYIKTKSAPLSVALRKYLHQYGFAWSKVRYLSSATLTTVPEHLPQPINNNPSFFTRGFAGQVDGTPTKLTASFLNEKRNAWDKTKDTKLTMSYLLEPSGNGRYTPELWSVDMDIAEVIATPPWSAVDVSALWTYARFQRTTDLDNTRAEFKLSESYRRGAVIDDPFKNLMKIGGPCRMLYNGVVLFDGYVDTKQPTLEGFNALQTSQYTAKDMWIKLNEKRVDSYKFLDGLKLLAVLKALLRKCGIPDSDIEVIDPDGYIANLEFAGFQDPNDLKAINQNDTVGNTIRAILNAYGVRPIRVRSVGGKMRIYAAPTYDPATPPTKYLYLCKSGTDIESMGDADRFAQSKYVATTSPEFTVEEPEFNSLMCRAADTSNNGAEAMQSVVHASYADPRSLTDPSYYWFIGREKFRILPVPEMVFANSQEELDKICYTHWKRFHRKRPILELGGEWGTEMDVDEFVWVVGVDPDGNKVSYGAYRIEHVDVEMSWDPSLNVWVPSPTGEFDLDTEEKNGQWEAHANYTLSFVGKAANGTFPMFTTDDKLPL
jgi:hypothetical protein